MMDRKRGSSPSLVLSVLDEEGDASSSSSSSDSEDDEEWLDAAYMGSYWVKDANEERERERWMEKIGRAARREAKEARRAAKTKARAEKREALKKAEAQRLENMKETELRLRRAEELMDESSRNRKDGQRRVVMDWQQQSQHPQVPQQHEEGRLLGDILRARMRRKSEDSRDKEVRFPTNGLMDGGSRIGEPRLLLVPKPRSASTDCSFEQDDSGRAKSGSDSDLRRYGAAHPEEGSSEDSSDSGGHLSTRSLSLEPDDGVNELRLSNEALKLEFKRRWSLSVATNFQSSTLDAPSSSPSTASPSPTASPSTPSSSSSSGSGMSSPSSSSSFRYLSWVREGGSMILNREKTKRERRGQSEEKRSESQKRTKEKTDSESESLPRTEGQSRARSVTTCVVQVSVYEMGDLAQEVLHDNVKKRSVSVGNKTELSKAKGNGTEQAEPTTTTTTTTSTGSDRRGRGGGGSSSDRMKRELSGRTISELDKQKTKKKDAPMSRSRSLTDRNRFSLDAYYNGADAEDDRLDSLSVPTLQLKREKPGEEGKEKSKSKSGSPVQTRSKAVSKERGLAKSGRHSYRASVGDLSRFGYLAGSGEEGAEASQQSQQRKAEKQRRKDEKQREKAERKEREREKEREKELVRKKRSATDAASFTPRTFMSRLSGNPG